MQLYLLSRSLRLFDDELQSAQLIQKDRERIRSQLEKFVVTQLIIGTHDAWIVRQFLRLTVWLSFVVGPVLLLLAFQLQFLPYHSFTTTWVHRIVLLFDIALLWVMWPRVIASGTRLIVGAATPLCMASCSRDYLCCSGDFFYQCCDRSERARRAGRITIRMVNPRLPKVVPISHQYFIWTRSRFASRARR